MSNPCFTILLRMVELVLRRPHSNRLVARALGMDQGRKKPTRARIVAHAQSLGCTALEPLVQTLLVAIGRSEGA